MKNYEMHGASQESNDIENEGEVLSGSQNLFSQTPSVSPANKTELSDSGFEQCNQAVKAVLQMLQLYHSQLQRAQGKASKQLEWATVDSSQSFPEDSTSLIAKNKCRGHLASTLDCEEDKTDNEDLVSTTTRNKSRRQRTVFNPKVSSMFKFKVEEDNMLRLCPEGDKVVESTEKASKGNLLKKGTTWLKSKIGLKRKKGVFAESDDDFEGEEKRTRQSNAVFSPSPCKNKSESNVIVNDKIIAGPHQLESVQRNKNLEVSGFSKTMAKRDDVYSVIEVEDDSSSNEVAEQVASASSSKVYLEAAATLSKPANPSHSSKGRRTKIGDKISCPLCSKEFSPGIINEHAFSCDGTSKVHKRRNGNNKRLVYESSSLVNIDKHDIIETEKETEKKKYDAFEAVCKKFLPEGSEKTEVLPPQKRTMSILESGNTKLYNPSNKIRKEIENTNIAAAVIKLNNGGKNVRCDLQSRLKNQNNTEISAPNIFGSKTSRQSKKERDDWVSEESEDADDLDTTSDILQQYLTTSQTFAKVTTEKKKHMELDSSSYASRKSRKNRKEMIKCFVCNNNFPAGEVYQKHVEEEMNKIEMEGDSKTLNQKIYDDNYAEKKESVLQSNIGNRKSWTKSKYSESSVHSESVDAPTQNSDTIKVKGVSDSPIKNFKFIDENSAFDFCGQFQSKQKRQRESKDKNNKPSFKWKSRRRGKRR